MHQTPRDARRTRLLTERQAILLVGGVQFANILDFMMVMPLGPDFALALGIPTSHLGYIGGIYTLAAAFSGLLSAFIIDRLDRRTALLIGLAGLCCATLLGAFCWNFGSLLAVRALAGLFGGPVTAIGMSIIADVVIPQRRGTAMGKVMGAFSIASILGVPFGLELAAHFGWRAPFFFLSALILGLTTLAAWWMPSMQAHRTGDMTAAKQRRILGEMLRNGTYWKAFALLGIGIGAAFMLIPNMAAYVQHNMGYPRAQMGWLYFAGGLLSLVGMRVVGKLTDRYGSARLITIATAFFILVLTMGFISPNATRVPAMVIFCGFMLASSARNVSIQALNSKPPPPERRASFSSLQAAITHLASALGSFVASMLLVEMPDGQLEGMRTVGLIAVGLSMLLPLLARQIEAHLAAPQADPLPHKDVVPE